jgi:hypothetical protein
LCACADLESTLESVAALSAMDWQSFDRARLTEIWPTLICESDADRPQTEGELAERCCQTCETCAGQLVEESFDKSLVRPRSIGVLICRDERDEVMQTIKRLTDKTVPASVDASFENPIPNALDDGRYKSGYRWQLRETTSLADASVYPRNERWVGTFALSRCRAPEAQEQWRLDDGTTVQVTYTSVSDLNDERFLNVSYLSECILVDKDCVVAEGERMWPHLRLLADSHAATVVMIAAQDCWSEVDEVTYAIVRGDWMKLRY